MKGTVFAWILILVFGWITTFMWVIFTTITVEHVYPWAITQINDTDARETLDNQIMYHNTWPILFMIGLTLYGILSSLKRDQGEQVVSI